MLQRLSIRRKILAVIAVPVVVLLLAAGYIVANAASALGESRDSSTLLTALTSSREAVNALQGERASAVRFVHAVSDGRGKIARTNESLRLHYENLERIGNENPEALTVADELRQIMAGGSGTPSHADLAELDVSLSEDDWPVWPGEAEVAENADGFAALVAAVQTYAAGLTDPEIKEIVDQFAFDLSLESTYRQAYYTESNEFQASLIEAIPRTDSAVRTFRARLAQVPQKDSLERLNEVATDTLKTIEDATNSRDQIRTLRATPNPVSGLYSDAIRNALMLTTEVANVVGDSDLTAYLQADAALDNLVEALRSEELFVSRVIRQERWAPGEVVRFRRLMVESDVALGNAQTAVTPLEFIEEIPGFGVSYDPLENVGFQTVRDNIYGGNDLRLIGERSSQWEKQVEEELTQYVPVRDQIWRATTDRVNELSRAALGQTVIIALLAAGAVFASIIIALQISRLITGPLRRLTTTATAVRQELPRLVERVAVPGEVVDVAEVQIPVESQDEIGRLAEAFNSVNTATLSIASEQAALRASISEMFVNVARRDQVLLNRQLASIDEMERTEDNPTTLTKLFALDHLATRMRRNSESLLVLAGIETGRRLRRPMPLSDVIRTASSEIELYERVQLELDADPAMLGHSALTAAHMFAELLENATVFSDPDTPVVVHTAAIPQGFQVTISDSGIGMTPRELADAQARIDSTAASEILGAQRLGLFVVGRIARRIGARVELRSEEGRGTIATVLLASSLFDPASIREMEHQSATAIAADSHAPAAIANRREINQEPAHPATAPAPVVPVLPAPSRPVEAPAAVEAYQPKAVQPGKSLSGRDDSGDLSVDADAIPVPVIADEGEIQTLIAADAGKAPVAEEVDLNALTGGVSDVGLPTRRRRGPASAEPVTQAAPVSGAGEESKPVIGLPVRATSAQLSALEAEADESFQPVISPSEISPQTPEDRAAMFRGFRSRRSAEAAAAEFAEGAESVGQALRRGALPADQIPALAGTATESEVVPPALEPDGPGSAGSASGTTPAALESAVAETPSLPQRTVPERPVTTQSPLISHGYEPDPVGSAADSFAAVSADTAFEIPLLADDPVEDAAQAQLGEGDAPATPVPQVDPFPASVAGEVPAAPASTYPVAGSTPTSSNWETANPYAAQNPYAQPTYEQPTSAQPGYGQPDYAQPTYDQSAYSQPAVPEAPTYQAEPPMQMAAPTNYHEVVPPSVGSHAISSVPMSTTPSMDELIAGGSGPVSDVKESFFGRLFKRKREDEEQYSGTTQFGIPSALPPSAPTSYGQPMSAGGPLGGSPVAPLSAAPASTPMPMSAPPSADLINQLTGTARDAIPTPTQIPSTLFTNQAPTSSAPTTAVPGAGPAGIPSVSGAVFTPEPLAGAGTGSSGTVYSPEELAQPVGWEAAGQSALAAAMPEVATSYTPIVDTSPGPAGAGGDMRSDLFAELVSLAKDRPEIEKTRAGLARRRAAETPPPPVEPISEQVEVKPVARDADAVRQRFTSFYSGTQRAREDVAAMEPKAE